MTGTEVFEPSFIASQNAYWQEAGSEEALLKYSYPEIEFGLL